MNDLPLFAASSMEEDPTWSVTRLNEAISHALSGRFPQEIWVRGEIQGLARTRMRKHWYFELVEKDEYGDGVKGKLSVAL
ncbi:MAG TPA: exodeoxyribonuclease VII large subunit, partial [Candidatus Krumholzibacteria bacterium]|nr:exodeoxyribonuclease VII large subunit [Candidatus Krumholzibacteria bacterium]